MSDNDLEYKKRLAYSWLNKQDSLEAAQTKEFVEALVRTWYNRVRLSESLAENLAKIEDDMKAMQAYHKKEVREFKDEIARCHRLAGRAAKLLSQLQRKEGDE